MSDLLSNRIFKEEKTIKKPSLVSTVLRGETTKTPRIDKRLGEKLIDDFQQLKRYFRSWNEKEPEKSFHDRPAMKQAIENFEKYLKQLIT